MVSPADQRAPFKVLLVGAGQIGSRHLQALARSRLNLSIEVLEPVASARDEAVRRFHEMSISEGIKELRVIDRLDSSTFGGYADVAIIATGAGPRRDVTENLLDRIKVPFLILEKVLFQRLSDIDAVETLLARNGCKAWVNCARRLFPYSRDLKQLFSGDVLSISAQGGNWGLACNGIHLFDLLAFLSGVSSPDGWNTGFLDNAMYDAQRSGYKEFGGRIGFHLHGGHEITMKDDKSSGAPLIIDIIGRHARATIMERAALMFVSRREHEWKMEQVKIQIPFQSELTHKVVEEILTQGACGLTEFSESARLHKAYLGAFLEHMQKVTGVNHDVCPIT